MPISYVLSKPPPDQPVEDWLKWTRLDFERELSASSPKLAAIMGINKAGDIQYLFMPTIIPKAFTGDDDSSAIIGIFAQQAIFHPYGHHGSWIRVCH